MRSSATDASVGNLRGLNQTTVNVSSGNLTTGNENASLDVSAASGCYFVGPTTPEPICACGRDSVCCNPKYRWDKFAGNYVARTSCGCHYKCFRLWLPLES